MEDVRDRVWGWHSGFREPIMPSPDPAAGDPRGNPHGSGTAFRTCSLSSGLALISRAPQSVSVAIQSVNAGATGNTPIRVTTARQMGHNPAAGSRPVIGALVDAEVRYQWTLCCVSDLLGEFQVASVLRHGTLAAPAAPTVQTTGTARLWWFMASKKPVPGS
jgi:hypothetical protein